MPRLTKLSHARLTDLLTNSVVIACGVVLNSHTLTRQTETPIYVRGSGSYVWFWNQFVAFYSVVIVVAVFVIVLSALITAINRQYLNTTPFVSFTRLFRFVVFCFDFVKPLPNWSSFQSDQLALTAKPTTTTTPSTANYAVMWWKDTMNSRFSSNICHWRR